MRERKRVLWVQLQVELEAEHHQLCAEVRIKLSVAVGYCRCVDQVLQVDLKFTEGVQDFVLQVQNIIPVTQSKKFKKCLGPKLFAFGAIVGPRTFSGQVFSCVAPVIVSEMSGYTKKDSVILKLIRTKKYILCYALCH